MVDLAPLGMDHIAYTAARLLNIDDEGYPVQPYQIKEILTRFWMLLILFLSTLLIPVIQGQ